MRAPLYSEVPDEILSPAVLADPQSLYRRLRQTAPIARIGDTGAHLVTSWALVEEALGRQEDFSANLTGVVLRGPAGSPVLFPMPGTGAVDAIATADDPEHAAHRAVLQPQLTPTRVLRMEASVRRWVDVSLDGLLAAGQGDWTALAERIPALAIASLLGLPDSDVDHFRTWSMMGGDMLAGDIDDARLRFLGEETRRMSAYLADHLARADASTADRPDATLLATLARAVEQGVIPREAAVGIAIVLFGAAGESTAALIGSSLLLLARDADLAERLRRDPTLIPRFVEEAVRLEPPFNFHYRAVRRACRLGGYDLEPGDRLMLSWASANRDPSAVEEPDTLRLDRRHPKNHMSFGRGLHFCIGVHLARLETRIVVERTLARTRRLALDPAKPVVHAKSIFIRRPERLPLVSEAA
ncbi:MAG: cytochrome P450 [Myxococcota bacterium]